MPATASMTDVSRTDFTRRNDSFDQRKSGEEQKRKRWFPIHLVANILLYYSDLCWVILNSNVCSLNWYFLPESRPFMDDKREFPLVGSAALVSAACSRQLLCRINLIIATILFSFFFLNIASLKIIRQGPGVITRADRIILLITTLEKTI